MLLENGVDIGDETLTRPAKAANLSYYEILGQEGKSVQTRLELTITEGRYHQIKRMFAKIGKPVQYLKRLSMGGLELDASLSPGEFRRLTEKEINSIVNRSAR